MSISQPASRIEVVEARRMARATRPRGFTLVEVMVVVLIISVLASLAVPAFARIKRHARTTAIVNDFRVFAGAFDTYAHENGQWPAEAAAGVFPAGMDQRLNKTAWLRPTPMGGQYNWDYKQVQLGTTITAAVSISATASAPLPLDVNQLIDLENAVDGASINWLAGGFRLGSSLNPVFVVQP